MEDSRRTAPSTSLPPCSTAPASGPPLPVTPILEYPTSTMAPAMSCLRWNTVPHRSRKEVSYTINEKFKRDMGILPTLSFPFAQASHHVHLRCEPEVSKPIPGSIYNCQVSEEISLIVDGDRKISGPTWTTSFQATREGEVLTEFSTDSLKITEPQEKPSNK